MIVALEYVSVCSIRKFTHRTKHNFKKLWTCSEQWGGRLIDTGWVAILNRAAIGSMSKSGGWHVNISITVQPILLEEIKCDIKVAYVFCCTKCVPSYTKFCTHAHYMQQAHKYLHTITAYFMTQHLTRYQLLVHSCHCWSLQVPSNMEYQPLTSVHSYYSGGLSETQSNNIKSM